MNVKSCKQCGELKPIEQFRSYYGGRKGTYTTCRSCEKINSRAKYLEKKSTLTELERAELNKIYALYDAQRACGLQPPRRSDGRSVKLTADLDSMISSYTERARHATVTDPTLDTSATPPELLKWLSDELTEDPEYYLEDVYDELKAKYRPILRVNPESLLPDYDDTYAAVLDRILNKFYDYEEAYYNK